MEVLNEKLNEYLTVETVGDLTVGDSRQSDAQRRKV